MYCNALLFRASNSVHCGPDTVLVNTVNGESFTGLNFRGFHGFLEDCESFPMNILL